MSDSVLNIRNLSVDYQIEAGYLKALRQVNLNVPKRSIVGVVGESGCGKSTLISSIIRLLPQNAIIRDGTVEFEGANLLDLDDSEMRKLRGTQISVVFQDPMTNLNPVLSIQQQMTHIQYRDQLSGSQKLQKSLEMLESVGIADPSTRISQFPHEYSGGMLQRISIAMALQAKPSLLIADEPTTALDATLEVQIIHLLKDIQSEVGCSILFISHHLGVIAELCDHVVVMYAGEVVEQGTIRDVFNSPAHPYTKKLLECDPAGIQTKTRNLPVIPGDIPDLVNLSDGCIFRSRCDSSIPACGTHWPQRIEVTGGHSANCHLLSS